MAWDVENDSQAIALNLTGSWCQRKRLRDFCLT